MKIKKEEVERIALMAKISLKEGEADRFREELSSILDYVDNLKELDLSLKEERESLEEDSHLRKDEPLEYPKEERERLRGEKDGYFKIGKIR